MQVGVGHPYWEVQKSTSPETFQTHLWTQEYITKKNFTCCQIRPREGLSTPPA